MKKLFPLLLVVLVMMSSFAPTPPQGDNIEFTCMKMHKASNTCHFNFKVDGAKYRYVDIGCKFNKKKDDAIKKVKDGSLALAKDWKIDCPEAPEKKEGN